MLLSKLAEYAERLDLPPTMYDRATVRWFIDLSARGRLEGFVPLRGHGRRADRGKDMWIPMRTRTSGIRPLLLADKGEYVLGISRDEKEESRKEVAQRKAAEAHRQFVELVRLCARETREPTVHAVLRFLETWDPADPRDLPGDFSPEDFMTFRVDGLLPIELPSVQKFWARYMALDSTGALMTCLVCGEEKPVEKVLPVQIKGIPGGQTSGMALISANSKAFESYGLEQALIAPTCRDCGERFGKAMNALIKGEDTHLTVGPVVYLFWSRADVGFRPASLLGAPDASTVTEMLRSLSALKSRIDAVLSPHEEDQPAYVRAALRTPFSGQTRQLGTVHPHAFYAAALSASGGRVVVRDWLESTVEGALENLQRWFHWQRLIDWMTGKEGRPFGVFQLAASLYRDVRNIEPHVPRLLICSALHGNPLPARLLEQVVRRNRAEQGTTRARAVLTKMILLSQAGGDTMSDELVALNRTHPDPAYHCGRLLAQLEVIQSRAIPGIKHTLVDRYYGAASSAPASVFGVLLRNAQAHLQRLRKERRGLYEVYQAELADILSRIGQFPTVLDFRRQALFALGYYHQRAARVAALRATKGAASTGEEDSQAGEVVSGEGEHDD